MLVLSMLFLGSLAALGLLVWVTRTELIASSFAGTSTAKRSSKHSSSSLGWLFWVLLLLGGIPILLSRENKALLSASIEIGRQPITISVDVVLALIAVAAILFVTWLLLDWLVQSVAKRRAKTQGVLEVPRRMYEGNSTAISMALTLEASGNLYLGSELIGPIDTPTFHTQCLQAALRTSGFVVEPEDPLRREIGPRPMEYSWSIHPRSSGIHEVALILNRIDAAGQALQLWDKPYSIRVVQIDGLVGADMLRAKVLFGLITGILALLEALRVLGVLAIT